MHVCDDNNAAIFTNSSRLVTKSKREKRRSERMSEGANKGSSVNSTRSRTAIFASLRGRTDRQADRKECIV